MRIVFFVPQHHSQASFILKKFLEKNSKYVSVILESTTLIPNKSNLAALFLYIKVAGLNYVIPQLIKRLKFRSLSKAFNVLSLKDRSSEYFSYRRINPKISVIETGNINDPRLIKSIKKIKPDLFVSVFFNQIFKKEILKLPKLGTVNIHPAYLPSYRGVSPTFWVLANNEKETGVTIHTIDNIQIDAGRIVDRKRIKILPNDSESSLYRRCAVVAVELLQTMVYNLINDKNLFNRLPKVKIELGKYYSIPKKEAVEKFLKSGRRF